jgi:hypothetical protein
MLKMETQIATGHTFWKQTLGTWPLLQIEAISHLETKLRYGNVAPICSLPTRFPK